MKCCNHGQPVVASIPRSGLLGAGWHVWQKGCCDLPVWVCREGELNPADVPYCSLHGCERPSWGRVAHEADRELDRPTRRYYALPRPAMADPSSRPLLAGDVLVYLSVDDELIAWSVGTDFGTAAILSSEPCGGQAWVEAVDGDLVASFRAGRALSWDLDRLGRALRRSRPPVAGVDARSGVAEPLPTSPGEVVYGEGPLAVEVHWEVFSNAFALSSYATDRGGRVPCSLLLNRARGSWLRPLALHQAPFGVAGGLGFIGELEHDGRPQVGLFLVPDWEA